MKPAHALAALLSIALVIAMAMPEYNYSYADQYDHEILDAIDALTTEQELILACESFTEGCREFYRGVKQTVNQALTTQSDVEVLETVVVPIFEKLLIPSDINESLSGESPAADLYVEAVHSVCSSRDCSPIADAVSTSINPDQGAVSRQTVREFAENVGPKAKPDKDKNDADGYDNDANPDPCATGDCGADDDPPKEDPNIIDDDDICPDDEEEEDI